eukprot:maker-scaffold_3-snap-gene-9.46-mRNA-1 protein AED:0.60 eAED:0.60 QI:0/0/0/0.5/1/1/2/0/193
MTNQFDYKLHAQKLSILVLYRAHKQKKLKFLRHAFKQWKYFGIHATGPALTENSSLKVFVVNKISFLEKWKDHKDYASFFKMLKAGVPRGAVELKVKEKGLDIKILEKDPDSFIELDTPTNAENSMLNFLQNFIEPGINDPDYGPFFKMLKAKVPRGAIELKMKQKGLDVSVLDWDPKNICLSASAETAKKCK